jgi:hypothetical protein
MTGFRILPICALLFVAALAVAAESDVKLPPSGGIVVGKNFPVSADNPKNPHFESHLAVDPRDPKHMLATSTVHEGKDERSYIYATFDGGRHWTRGKTKSGDRTLFSGGDAVVYFNRRGTAFFVAGAKVKDESKTLIGRSTDGGRTWSEPLLMPYRDRPWLAFDETGAPGRFAAGPYDHTIYFAGMNQQQLRNGPQGNAIVFSRSIDDGKTFSNGELFQHDDGGPDHDVTLNPGALTDMLVAPGGALVIPFDAYLNPPGTPMAELDKKELVTSAFRILVSGDGGRTFSAFRPGPEVHSIRGFRQMHAFAAARSAMDMSRGPHRGQMYLVWSEWDGGKKRYVVTVARSSDLGKTWATTAVNDDSTDHDPSNPAIAVNADGVVAVVWNDRRDDPKGECWRLYGALSIDGGERFGKNVKMSDAPTCTNSRGNWQLDTWYQLDNWTDPEHPLPGFGLTAFVPVRFPNGGDTQGLVADRDGRFHAAWINGQTGVMQLWLTDFEVEPSLTERLRAANAAKVSASKTAPPPGRTDLTLQLELDVSRPAIDFEKGELSLSVRVKNPTAHPVRGPFDVVVARFLTPRAHAMGLAHFRVANADDHGEGDGARWTFSAGPGEILPAGGKTPPRVFKFAFDGGLPDRPDGYFEPGFFIYGRAGETP